MDKCFVGQYLTYPHFYFPQDLGHFIFKLQNFDIFISFFYFYTLFGPVTGSLRRLEPHWRISLDAPVFALNMLLSCRRDISRFEITELSKLLVLPW